MKISLLLFSLNLFVTFCESKNKKVICDSPKDITLNENEIVFIESPDFPNSLTKEMMENCTLNIYGNVTDEESMFLTIVLTNGFLTDYNFVIIDGGSKPTILNVNEGGPEVHPTTNSSIIFTYGGKPPRDDLHLYFQGYIIYEKYYNPNSCDMVNIAQPLFLDDETEIIYIYANYYNKINVNCSWTFTAPKDYGFKFTSIMPYKIDISNATVIVKNSSDYIITDIYTKPNIPYYNVDHNITVILEASSISPVFNAFITIVKKDFNRTIGNCTEEDQGGFFRWSNSFYPNNSFCDLSTNITSNQQLFVSPKNRIPDFENIADPISLEIDSDENNIVNMFTKYEYLKTIPFGPYENGTAKTLFWQFLSDGSITTSGFNIDFIYYDCECNSLTIIVPCEGEYKYTLIDTSNISDNLYKNYYCANMGCIFTILIDENCQDKYILAKMGVGLGPYGNSSFKLISNNETMIDLSISNSGISIIKPNSNTTFEFNSGVVLETGQFSMHFQAYEKFNVLPKIIVTNDIPWQVLDSYFHNKRMLLPIELSDELKKNNDSLQIDYYSSPLTYLQFYADLNLTIVLQENKINSMNLKSFVIFINTYIENKNFITVKAKKASSENCRFKETIFYINEPINADWLGEIFLLKNSMLSNEQGGYCKILIVNYLYIMVIKSLFSYENKNQSQIEIFNGLNDQTKLVDFNQTDATLWQSLVLHSLYYVIKIPENTSLFFESYEFVSGYDEPAKIIYISSPCYSLLETVNDTPFTSNARPIFYSIQNITVQFTVRDYDISKNGTLEFEDALGNKKILTGVNQTLEYFSTNVTVKHKEPEKGYKGARIYLKAFHKNIH